MRDYGFNFFRYDKYCQNIFADGFDFEGNIYRKVELLTAFELFEHFINPSLELDKLIQYSHNILFTTEILPSSNPKPGEWWYYGIDHGQHISFYTLKSLQILAESKGLKLFSNSRNYHLLTRKRINPFIYRILC
jgi:hypothetical protein